MPGNIERSREDREPGNTLSSKFEFPGLAKVRFIHDTNNSGMQIVFHTNNTITESYWLSFYYAAKRISFTKYDGSQWVTFFDIYA